MPEMKPPKIGDGKAKTGNPATKQSFANAIDSILKDDPMKIKSGFFFFEKIRTKEEFQEAFDFVINNLNNKKYQPYLGKILDVIGQNGQVLGPTKWFSGMETIFSEPCPPDIREYALSSSNYLLSFYSNFGEELVKNISIENIKDYNKTGKYLKFIFYLSKYSQGWQFSEHLTEEIKDKLSQFTDNNPENNYLLSKFSQGILDGVDNKNHPRSRDLPFFKINSQNQYGAVYEDGFLHVSDPMDSEEIKSKIESIRELELLIGKVDIRQLQSEAIKLKDSIEDLVAKNTIKPDDLDTVSIKQNKEQLNELYKNYLFLLDGIMRPIIEEDFGDAIFTMPIKEQLHFLSYAKDLKVKEIAPIKKFAKDYGVTGFRTFLSLEHGGKEMGDKIIALGEKLPKEVAEELFKKYSTFVDQANSLEDFIKNNFAKDFTNDSDLLNKIREYIYKKGEELISSMYSKSSNNDFSADQVLKDLDNIQVEKGLLFSIIKLLKSESSEFNIEDVFALDLQTLRPGDFVMAEHLLSNSKLDSNIEKEQKEILDIKNQMEQIYKDNYSDMPELQRDLLLDFNNFIKGEDKYRYNAGSEINILKYYGKVVSFNRFELVFLNKLNFKSFNVDKSIQGSGIGQLMTKATLDEKAKYNTILADCLSSKPISSYYIENGFIARRFYSMHGQPCLSITRDDKFIPKEFKTKTLSVDDILAENNLPKGTIVKKSRTQEECDFSYIIPENYSKVPKPLPNYKAPEKYVLTRYFFDKNSKEWVTVFEPVEKDLNEYL